MKRRAFLGILAGSSLGPLGVAWAQAFPSAPVKMIVPYAAGGGLDAVARMLAKGMAEELKQAVIVDNRPGAGGLLGAEVVAKSAPDGYTLLMAGNPELTISPSLQAKPTYSAVNDFTPIVLVAQSPNVLVANTSLGAKNLREALEAAKKAPAGLSIGTPGNGTPQHIAVEVLKSQTGLDIVHVPYKGAAPATLAAVSGEATFALIGAPPVLPHVASGKLVALAVTQTQRSPLVASVPTVGEALGVMTDADFLTWYGLLAPSRTPAAALQALEKAAFAVLGKPDVRPQLAALGTDLVAMPSGQFAERMKGETKRYAELIKRFNIKGN